MKKDDESDDEMEELKHKYQHHHGTMRHDIEKEEKSDVEWTEEECPMSMQSGRRRAKNKKNNTTAKRISDSSNASTSSSKRSASSSSSKNAPKSRKKWKKEADEETEEDPMDQVYCIACHQGKDEDLLLLCDISGCNNGRHTYCCDPVLDEVPEGEWRCPKCIETEDAKIGLDWGFYDADTEYNLNSFTDFANTWKCEYFGVNDPSDVSCDTVEKEFWRNVISQERTVAVKYGADLITSRVGSGFPRKEDRHSGSDCKLKQQYAHHAWNLNNMPVLRESVLSHFNTGISGMMVPWVYVGMCFSTFCWHTEDHWTYSVNYNHFGERKIWYGVGGDDAEKFEDALRKLAPGLTGRQRDLFHHMTTAANPALLRSMGVPIYSVHQNAGEFVITFPRAYHAGYNEGLNFAEAVNFAPIDWLAKGRECVHSYSSVRRYLVFSHDELVFKMVESMDKLGLSMSLATYEEVKLIKEKQKKQRQAIARLGINQKEHVIFEKIPDEQRSCRFCKTTFFMSGISCKHKKMTCVEHYGHLCKTCVPKDCKYQYRHEISYLEHLCEEFGKRTVDYSGWKEESEEMLETKGKPGLERIEQFIDEAKQNKYPQTDQVSKLMGIRQTAKGAIEKANQLLFKKVRTRTKTRCQRADTRTDAEGVRALIEQMQAMDCNLAFIIDKLERWMENVDSWRIKAREAISHESAHSKESFDKLIEEGDEFDIKMVEIDELKKVIQMKEWVVRAQEVTSWTVTADMEKDPEYEYKTRWTCSDILSLIRDGSRTPTETTSQLTAKLQIMLREANIRESEATEFMKKPSLDTLQDTWNNVRKSDWFSDSNIDTLRTEIVMVMKIKTLIDAAIPSLSKLDLHSQLLQLTESEITLANILEILRTCEQSICLNGSTSHLALNEAADKIKSFTERMSKLFKPINAYHNLFEILSERDDLTPLAEGQVIPLYYQGGPIEPSGEWHQMAEFDSLEQMLQHQTSLREMQTRIFEKVHTFNRTRGIDACSCLGTAKIHPSEPTLTCMLCESQFHVKCCEWSTFLQRLPQGCFLCVRCLRGRRPVIDDVTAALNGAPSGCLEINLVRNLIQKARSITQNLMDGANKRASGEPQGEIICKRALSEWLSCEILNMNGLPKAIELIKEFYADYLQKQSSASLALQHSLVSSTPAYSLFDPKISTKRKRNSASHREFSSKRTKKRSIQHSSPKQYFDEDEAKFKLCQARNCLKPYGDALNWVMCEAGCKNWYHVVCVGFTLKEVERMHEFRCTSCLDHADSPSSSASFD
uniref:[Histone H3]-trimethyl-L-lysine(4) demethylase n=1 Tax=Caenorhabditis japonica TaxID=281687 RepID=A0A8R1DFB9_CAEJA